MIPAVLLAASFYLRSFCSSQMFIKHECKLLIKLKSQKDDNLSKEKCKLICYRCFSQLKCQNNSKKETPKISLGKTYTAAVLLEPNIILSLISNFIITSLFC